MTQNATVLKLQLMLLFCVRCGDPTLLLASSDECRTRVTCHV